MTADADSHPTEDQLRGQRVVRREDPVLITGHAEYTDDLRKPRMLHAAIVRSQYGHAEIEAVDTADAEAVDGVVAVLTGADVDRKVPLQVIAHRYRPSPTAFAGPAPALRQAIEAVSRHQPGDTVAPNALAFVGQTLVHARGADHTVALGVEFADALKKPPIRVGTGARATPRPRVVATPGDP